MVHVTELAAAVSAISGILSLGLVVFAVRAYRRTRSSQMAFLVGAFMLFSAKAFLVAYSIMTGLIEHEVLELVDAIGDMGTMFLILVPIFWPERTDGESP